MDKVARTLPRGGRVDTPSRPRHLVAADDLAELVLGYLREHPHAADTLAGIAEWWVPRQQIRVDTRNLQRALDRLTERGLLESDGSGGARRYRLARQAAP
jgi:hypothetical protein